MSIVAFFTVNKSLDFAGNQILYDASGSSGTISSYTWNMDDIAPLEITPTASANHRYIAYGSRKPSLIVYNGLSASEEYFLDNGILINPQPEIVISGHPIVNSEVSFYDHNAPFYFAGTISAMVFDPGDGSLPTSGLVDDIFLHTYTSSGNVNVVLSAFDTAGNASFDCRAITILMEADYIEKSAYINICGPDNSRVGPAKKINLTNFLPDYLQEEEFYDLVKFYEDFLNEMYSGINGMTMTETQTNTSASEIRFEIPDEDLSTNPQISILEKIKRIAELHDPDLIDMEYIQFFANYLGYNININSSEIGNFGTFNTDTTICSASDINKYTRFIIGNLPTWYKIKTTDNMVQIMLYSFGLISEIVQFYTKRIADGGYDPYLVNWKMNSENFTNIPDSWFPTPHFSVLIDIDKTLNDNPDDPDILSKIMIQGDRIIKAVHSVRPINTVFHKLLAKSSLPLDPLYVGAENRMRRYIRIDPEGYSDWWNT